MTATHTTAKQVTEAIGAYGEVNHGGAVSNWLAGANIPTKAHYEAMRVFFNTRNGQTDHLRREYEDLRREYEDLRRPFALKTHMLDSEIWAFPTLPPSPDRHPCEKPLPLLKHIVTVSSRPTALILDCFAGSGSTLDAARQLGRRWLGCDSDPVWVARARQRLEAPYTPSLFGEGPHA
jgi:site-specific DNA-methyltransferase (adenine-specific)